MAFYYKNSTNVYISKAASASAANASDTVQLNVIDFNFNQSSSTQKVGRNTLSPTQDRGITPHISVVSPVTFSITTYITPLVDTNVTSPEEYLWLGLMGVDDIGTPTSVQRQIDFEDGYNVAELLNLIIWFIQPGLSEGNYRLDDAIVDTATIDIDINGLAQVTFTGRALSIVEDNTAPTSTDRTVIADDEYLKTRLSTVDFWYNNYAGSADLFLKSGTINIKNNNTFYGRTQLGKTTVPVGHYTGNREFSGELEVYLKDGTDETVDFYNWVLSNISTDTYEDINTRPGLIYIKLQGNEGNNFIISLEDAIFEFPKIQFNTVFSMKIPFVVHETIPTGNRPTITHKHN